MNLNTPISFPWQFPQWHLLMQQVQANRLPHALLLHGMPGLGKRHFVDLLSHRLLCLQPTTENYPCYQCRTCQLYQADSHPDLWIVRPEKESKTIKIQQIRDLITWLGQTSQTGDMRIAIIELAEQMTTAAANALLKTLEEPGANSLLLLLSHSPNALPATVRSRCQALHFAPLSQEEIKLFLAHNENNNTNESNQVIELMARLAQGAPLATMSAEKLAQRQLFWQQWLALQKGQQDPIVVAREWAKLELMDVLDWLGQWVVDALAIKLALPASAIINSDYNEKMAELNSKIFTDTLFNYWDKLLSTKRTLLEGVNLNKQMVLEDLLCFYGNLVNKT